MSIPVWKNAQKEKKRNRSDVSDPNEPAIDSIHGSDAVGARDEERNLRERDATRGGSNDPCMHIWALTAPLRSHSTWRGASCAPRRVPSHRVSDARDIDEGRVARVSSRAKACLEKNQKSPPRRFRFVSRGSRPAPRGWFIQENAGALERSSSPASGTRGSTPPIRELSAAASTFRLTPPDVLSGRPRRVSCPSAGPSARPRRARRRARRPRRHRRRLAPPRRR